MRRLGRYAFNAAAALSAFLCLEVLALWVGGSRSSAMIAIVRGATPEGDFGLFILRWMAPVPYRELVVRLPVLFAVTAILPALYVRQAARGRRPAADQDAVPCASCGYDLCGNVSGVCPECGKEIQKSAAGFSN